MSLQAITEYEARIKKNLLSRLLNSTIGTRLFAQVYRRIGPAMDRWLMRRPWGRAVLRAYGLPMLVLRSTGARSGQPRLSPLLYVRDGDSFALVGTNFGQAHHPAWTANLLAQPEVSIQVGPYELPVRAELVDDATWEKLWSRFIALASTYENYLGRTRGRKPRIFLLRARGTGESR